MCANM